MDVGVAVSRSQPDPERLTTAADLLVHAQATLDRLPTTDQAWADQYAEELHAVLALRELPLIRTALLGFICGVAEVIRLLEQLAEPVDRTTRKRLRDELFLFVGRLAQSSVPLTGLEPLLHSGPDDSPRRGAR
jgi:hypothetical protein